MSASDSESDTMPDEWYFDKLLPRFRLGAPLHPSTRVCLHCNAKITPGERVYCFHCNACVYCSDACRFEHRDKVHCWECPTLAAKIDHVNDAYNKMVGWRSDESFRQHNRHFIRGDLLRNGYRTRLDADTVNYFKAREQLIKALICQATGAMLPPSLKSTSRNVNTMGLEIALMQCQDSLWLDEYDCDYSREDDLSPRKEYLFSLCLFTGKYEELYWHCCYFAERGERQCLSTAYDDIVRFPSEVQCKDISESFCYDHCLDYRSFPYLSLSYIFILKYVLHLNMETLRLLRENGVDNEDCLHLIGEYVGLNKRWLNYEEKWYLDQALEILEFFVPSNLSHCFGQIHGCSEVFLDSGHFEQINVALRKGKEKIQQLQKATQSAAIMTVSDCWAADVNQREEDLKEQYQYNIAPYFETAVEKLNQIAGYSALSRCFKRFKSATAFTTDAMQICENNAYCFEDFLADMDTDDNFLLDSFVREFSYELLQCLLFERRLAQSYFYRSHVCAEEWIDKSKEGNKRFLAAHAALKQLAPELSPYTFVHPPPLPDDDAFFGFSLTRYDVKVVSEDIVSKKIKLVSGWLPDVTNVIDALFHAGLATEKNLTAIFGNSSLVSTRIWELERLNAAKKQRGIASFFSKTIVWKEGCTRYESSSGLKLRYLKRSTRAKLFEQMENRSLMDLMEPSLSQFCEKYGWDNLGITSNASLFSLPRSNPWNSIQFMVSGIAKAKRRRRGLDGFDSVKEACRLYFDTSSLEDAIFDFLNIPRLRVVNGDKDTMAKSSWTELGKDCFLGDKSVVVGSRIALDWDGNWWSEK